MSAVATDGDAGAIPSVPTAAKSPTKAALRAAQAEARLASVWTTAAIGARPRLLNQDLDPVCHDLALKRYQSPLRYPGAKRGLSGRISELLRSALSTRLLSDVALFVEPFAGGAATSLRLVGAGVVERVLLADADPLVAAFWQVAASDTERLIDRMTDEHRRFAASGTEGVARWDHWRSWRPAAGAKQETVRFEAAVKCLVLNRTTFSGILHGSAGPIGGRQQSSAYPIACRFHPHALAERLRYVQHLYEGGRIVDVWCKDWRATLADVAEWYPQLVPNRVVAYLDPPYVSKSRKLYQRSFDPHGGYAAAMRSTLEWSDLFMHERLAEYLRGKVQFRWILSYDADPVLLSSPMLYRANRMHPAPSTRAELGTRCWSISKRYVSLSYSAAARTRAGATRELLLTTLPPRCVPSGPGWEDPTSAEL